MDINDFNDPDRHLKRLQNIVGVSTRIQKLAQKKRRSLRMETKEEMHELFLKSAKEDRHGRIMKIGLNHRHLMEMSAHCFGVRIDEVLNCAADTEHNINVLSGIFHHDGAFMILVQYQHDDGPTLASGRSKEKFNRQKMDMALFSNGTGKKIIGPSVILYRTQNSIYIDFKNLSDNVFCALLPDCDSVISAIYSILHYVVRPALGASKEFGNCSESQKLDFMYGVDHFLQFIKSSKDDIITCTINFEVNNELFKGFLLAPHQIEATSRRLDKIVEVEYAVQIWMKQIKRVISKGHQIGKDGPDAGPLTELEYWRRMLTTFYNVIEFTDSRAFQSYFKCLKLSRSKLLVQWNDMQKKLIDLLNEARDNVRSMLSIETFWDPLYCCEPSMIGDSLKSLLQALRSVYSSSRFYNTSLRITGFLSKVTNQLIIACQKFLTNRYTTVIWEENMDDLRLKIKQCKELKETYRHSYRLILLEMRDAGETPFDCSEKYLFERMDLFENRLEKIHEIMDICLRYQVLDQMKIAGMERFSERINEAFKCISDNTHDPLSYRLEEFNLAYVFFQKEICNVEVEMAVYLRNYMAKIVTTDMRLVALKRFQQMKLDCLAIDARLLDVAIILENEMENIKDMYNEKRSEPPNERSVPPVIGRIKWARALLHKMVDPLSILKKNSWVIDHPKCQLCIKFYNYISGILLHYEILHHKAWYSYSDQVRQKLEVPIIRKNAENNHYEVNIDRFVFQVIKETECMWKLKLDVPESAQILAYCKYHIINAHNKISELIRRNENLRRSIYPMFVPMMRIHLIKLEHAFAPALSSITWLKQNHDDYFSKVSAVLLDIECFVKEVSDINDAQIEVTLGSIAQMSLVYLPQNTVTHDELKELNTKHRQMIEKKIESKSLAAEKAAVDLINKFVSKTDIPDYDDSGKFQMPQDKIRDNRELKRIEDFKPINKYDWLSFDKIHMAVGYPSEEENKTNCFKDYDGLNYDVTLLHIDCVELFAYYNHRIVATLVKTTIKSMEKLKTRSLIKGNSLLRTMLRLKIPHFIITPNIQEIQENFDAVLLNMIETYYAISTWGKQGKTSARKLRAPLLDEVRYERNFFNMLSQHKEIIRYMMSFDGGLLQIEPDINRELKRLLQKYAFLWAETRDDEIDSFVKGNPLGADIQDKLMMYDEITSEILKFQKTIKIGSIEIITESAFDALAEESKSWKSIIGIKLGAFYKEILDEREKFIQTQQKCLSRNLSSLDDCQIAMDCLNQIRENFIEIDESLTIMEEAYAVFSAFEIDIPPEDTDRVDGLRYLFNNMIENAEKVSQNVNHLQKPLQEELEAGVAAFKFDLQDFDDNFVSNGPMAPGISAKEASDRVLFFEAQYNELCQRHKIYSSGEKLFGLPVNEYPVLQKYKKDLNYLNKLYKLYLDVMKSIDGYSVALFKELDMESIKAELGDFESRCKTLPRGMRQWPAFIELSQKIKDFQNCYELLEVMAKEAVKERHWFMMGNLMSFNFEPSSSVFTLGSVLEAPLLEHASLLQEICEGALKEQEIEIKLQSVASEWKNENILLAPFKNRGELLIKAQDAVNIMCKLEDGLMVFGSLIANRFNKPYKKEILLWHKWLTRSHDIIERWLQVQSLWMYLEAVFVGGDIARQLPFEAKRFSNIDKSWVHIMMKVRDTSNVIEICNGDDTVESTLKFLLEQLEICQRSLTGYLETKRMIFPRFFFISDPVLLEILGQASEPAAIQSHLLSIFDGVARVAFDDKHSDHIITIFSSNDEKVQLIDSVKCIGNVEIWLGKFLEIVQETIRTLLMNLATQMNQDNFNYKYQLEILCGQAQLICVQLLWTKSAQKAIQNCQTDKKIMSRTLMELKDMMEYLVAQTAKDLSRLQRVAVETLVTVHIHQFDIFNELTRSKVKSEKDFDWQKQARFYFDPLSEEVIVKITDIAFSYQNEYLGVTDRLAITPLTDRCYITLAQAIGMNMGGAPAGPAGTGKTETTKDMGRALGKYVVVFNCSDQMDFRGLGRIYKGLAQSGTWGCFDEFNRIELPVLSVAAQQISIVLTARKTLKKQFVFSDGETIKMNPELGIFITMNPGYAGRQELPENLKIQFRTVSMMVPDRQIIMRVKLASCGFQTYDDLASKFFVLYKLCEEQLSKQVHYDFGLRNILSCLRSLGAQKRAPANAELSEDRILMQVLRDMNLSKLVDEDEPLFRSLISDIFPSCQTHQTAHRELQIVISEAVEGMKLINETSWNLKIIQLYETSLVRHGLMVLGPTGAGKTKCINTLLQALTIQRLVNKEERMNPKAITAPQMFGQLDVTTNEWTDGIFSVLWRKSQKTPKKETKWLVLDGPVDALWIENLNSVLDDNKTLTLANGDRIAMAPNCKLLFEPDAIDNASPATVSRMGMVFMSSSVLPWTTILEGWIKLRPMEQAIKLRGFFNKIYGDLNLFVQTKLKSKMKIFEALYIRQTCDLLTGMLAARKEDEQMQESTLENIFLFATMWSFGALLELDARHRMEEFVLNHHSKMRWPPAGAGESIFEYLVNEKGQWDHWNSQIKEYIYPSDSVPDYHSILVPNVDNVRTSFLLSIITKQKKAVLLIGEPGTAKTVMIKRFMSHYDPENHTTKCINFSSATTPNMFQRIVESYVDRRVGTIYGPPQGRNMTIFIDDVNMPVVNEWGDQITNEILRQLMENGGFYSLDRPGDFSHIHDIQFVSAMIHPGGGRNDIPSRLKRHFNIFNCTLPSNNSIDKIFSVIGRGYFCISRFNREIVKFVADLIPLTRKLWQETKVKMLPTPAKFHYVFNLRDLSRIWGGILRIESEQCQTISSMLKLWRHECTRVISDRFTCFEDRDWFVDTINRLAETELLEKFSHYSMNETFFVDFLRETPEAQDDAGEESSEYFIYEEIPSINIIRERVLGFMSQYNLDIRGSKLDLVFFTDALIHLMIISRILKMPRGNALLVGVGGIGKQSLTKLASYIAGYQIHQIVSTRLYTLSNFADELKLLYRIAGLKGHGISFIFTDNDIKDESFLEYLNNVLNSGEIANLFAKDEIDEITNLIIPFMKKENPKCIPTQENLYDFFISRARNNLHVVLCFSPVGEKFRDRAMKFPGLISGCMIDWFQRWPMDALTAVSNHYLQEFNVNCQDEVKQELIEIMAFVQDNVSEVCLGYFEKFRRVTHITPKSFLTFLKGYKDIYYNSLVSIVGQSTKMTSGIDKLNEAAESIDQLREDFEAKKIEIAVAEANAEEVIENVEKIREGAEIAKEEVAEKQILQSTMVDNVNQETAVAQIEFDKTVPLAEKALEALMTIKSGEIAVVRRLGRPPFLITVIMDAVLLLFHKKILPVRYDDEKQFMTPSWNESLKLMGDTRFLNNLKEFNLDLIDAEMVDLLQPYYRYPQYNVEAAAVACGQVSGLLKWTISMAEYYEVNKFILPLKVDLEIKKSVLNKAKTILHLLEDALAEKVRELQAAERKYDVAYQCLQNVKDEAALLQNKLYAANALITGLSEERNRWTAQIGQFKEEIICLVGDVLFLTGFLSYMGPFNQEFRCILQDIWKNEMNMRRIPFTADIRVIERLTDTSTIGEWNLQGLPTDEFSIQNGIITTQCFRYPLLIDPQSQGKFWIKQKEKDSQLIVTSLSHKYFRTHLEDAIQIGRPLLIEDIGEELDPCLDNVLEKNLIKIGNLYKVKIGDKEIDVHSDFRMFLTTKLANPIYAPDISARTSIIDFSVTMRGLEDQLLGRVILSERREVEDERIQLETDVSISKKLSKELEANLLFKLWTTQGSLLDDLSVMEVLNISKAKAIEIKQKLESAEIAKEIINCAREEFRLVASRGSVLYFLIVKMILVNNMYQTSLVQFLQRFDHSLEHSEKSPITLKRVDAIIEFLTYDIFKYVSRGLYEKHKFLFTLMMALDIDMFRQKVSIEEFQYFIKGGTALDLNACPRKISKWISDATWLNIVKLSSLRQFGDIISQVHANSNTWKKWSESDEPEEEIIPDGYDKMDPFIRLLIIRTFCLDRTLAQSRKYIKSSIGAKYNAPVVLDYEDMLAESRTVTPIICFLSMGSDPTPSIEDLAKKNSSKLFTISMGQGQEIHARKLVLTSLNNGSWVLLQNCHLGLDYMEEVTLQLIELGRAEDEINERFRLWITTEEHLDFPITMLQTSIKFTNQPPAGIKAGLIRTYGSMSTEIFDHTDNKYYLPLVFAVSFLHTIVQERRKFGALGWNIPYEFNSSDWFASCLFLQNHLGAIDKNSNISWKSINYMIGEVHYGGRVTDDFDKRLIVSFAKKYFNSDLVSVENFSFYDGYDVVRKRTIEEYVAHFKTMSNVDPPSVYGLHPNADISYQTRRTLEILDIVISVQPKDSPGSGGDTRESAVARLSNDMLQRMPKPYDMFEVKEKLMRPLEKGGGIPALNIFLRQEIERIQRIILLVKATLLDLLLAVEGSIIMNEQLRDTFDSIYDARVPKFWQRSSWHSSTLGFWFAEFIERNIQYNAWCFKTQNPIAYWIKGLFNPQGFLTAMRQKTARENSWPLDKVTLQNEVLKILVEDCKEPAKFGVLVYGLYLDGAGWNRKEARLTEAVNKILYTSMPVIRIFAVNSPRVGKYYDCPVYKTANRMDLNYITTLGLPILGDKSSDHWIQRGVALLCDIK